MTPTPAPDEPIDPAVRSLLWRLRARLVTPPDETRTSADLDRLFVAAREHAHDAPVPDIIRIVPPVMAGDDEDLPAGVTSIAPRRYRMTTMASRVAAGVVLVVAVSGGLASARDGNGLMIQIQALAGRSAAEPAEPDTLAGGPDVDVADVPESVAVPLPGDGDSAEVADDPDQNGSTPPAGAEDGTAGGTPAGTDESTDDAPVEAPRDEIIAAPAPVDPVEPPAGPDEPSGGVVAPPPSEVVGTGGPIPCREGESLASCFERRTAEGERAEAEAPAEVEPPADDVADDPTEDTTGTDDDAAAREALATRRGS